MISLKNKTLLVVVAHPDDEIYGCGGFISKIKKAGGKAYVLFLTNGTTKDFSPKGKSLESERVEEINNVAKLLKYNGYKVAFPGDGYHLKLDQLEQKDLIHEIESGSKISLEAIKPDIVAFHSEEDYNQDHRAVAQAAFTALGGEERAGALYRKAAQGGDDRPHHRLDR
ncbi:PIG-L family deacetylase [Patescibacteria group bacterium]|nr:PIG-L family deacetylase [Patescibacteria group bacterium]